MGGNYLHVHLIMCLRKFKLITNFSDIGNSYCKSPEGIQEKV